MLLQNEKPENNKEHFEIKNVLPKVSFKYIKGLFLKVKSNSSEYTTTKKNRKKKYEAY